MNLARIKLIVAVVAVLIAAGVIAWWHNDRHQIRRRLEHLRSLGEKTQAETQFASAMRAQDISKMFSEAPDVSFGFPFETIADRRELMQIVFHARSMVDGLRFVVRDVKITLGPEPQTAGVELTAEAFVKNGGREDRDIRTFKLDWVKEDGDWVIRKVRNTDSIQRPPGLDPGI